MPGRNAAAAPLDPTRQPHRQCIRPRPRPAGAPRTRHRPLPAAALRQRPRPSRRATYRVMLNTRLQRRTPTRSGRRTRRAKRLARADRSLSCLSLAGFSVVIRHGDGYRMVLAGCRLGNHG
jgi:hypothetical protein